MSIRKKILSKLPKFDLSKTEDKLKLVILLGGLLIVFASLGVGGLAYTMRSNFCSSCHEMQPEYSTWSASVHSQIGCVDCHIEPGPINLMKDKLGAMVQVYKHLTTSYDSPIEYPVAKKGPVKNEQCLKCHSENRQYAIPGDIVFSHDKHLAQGANCVDCHSGVAHGNVAERGESKASVIPFKQWTTATGTQQMVPKYSSPTMETCIKCHTERKQTTSCTSCHSAISVPDSHKDNTNWQISHGTAARADINSCDKCHSYGFTQPIGDKKMDADQYAKTNTFCLDCHLKTPASHGNLADETWINNHKTSIQPKGIEGCLACHDLKPGANPAATNNLEEGKPSENKPKNELVNKVYCTQCHGSKFGT